MENVSANITVTRSPENPDMIIITDNDTGVTYDPVHISQVWELFNDNIVNVIMAQLYAPEEPAAAPEQGIYPDYVSTPHDRYKGSGGFKSWFDDFANLGSSGFGHTPSGRLRLDPNNDNIFHWFDVSLGDFIQLTRQEIDALRETNPGLYQQIQAEMMTLGNARWHDVKQGMDTDFPIYEQDPGGLYSKPEEGQADPMLEQQRRRSDGMEGATQLGRSLAGAGQAGTEQLRLKRGKDKQKKDRFGKKEAAHQSIRDSGVGRSTRSNRTPRITETPERPASGERKSLNKRYESAWARMRGGR